MAHNQQQQTTADEVSQMVVHIPKLADHVVRASVVTVNAVKEMDHALQGWGDPPPTAGHPMCHNTTNQVIRPDHRFHREARQKRKEYVVRVLGV